MHALPFLFDEMLEITAKAFRVGEDVHHEVPNARFEFIRNVIRRLGTICCAVLHALRATVVEVVLAVGSVCRHGGHAPAADATDEQATGEGPGAAPRR